MSIKMTDEIRSALSREAIQRTPLEALKELLYEVNAGRIRLHQLYLRTDTAKGGRIQFVFSGEAEAVLTEADISQLMHV